MSGLKFDQGKPDMSMVSLELMEEVAYVRMFGAAKYARDNWKKGFKVTRSCAAALRHIFSFLAGQTNDPESGRSHLAHAVCCLEHAIYDMRHHPANDDRAEPSTDEQSTKIVYQSRLEAVPIQYPPIEYQPNGFNDWIAP